MRIKKAGDRNVSVIGAIKDDEIWVTLEVHYGVICRFFFFFLFFSMTWNEVLKINLICGSRRKPNSYIPFCCDLRPVRRDHARTREHGDLCGSAFGLRSQGR
jgi:hypothetical protein